MDDGGDRSRLVDDADVGEHAPFEVEEAVALAEADAVERHRRSAGDHEVEPAARRHFGKRDRPAEMFDPVEPRGEELLAPGGTMAGSIRRKPR